MYIRKATENDAQAAWDIRKEAINFQCIAHYPVELLKVWTEGEITETFIEEVAHHFYVAIKNDEVIGTGKINFESGKVDAIFTLPGHMGVGIGKTMLSHLEELARKVGLTNLNLESTLNAAVFYRKCGFAGNKIAKYESPRGISMDCIPMFKKL